MKTFLLALGLSLICASSQLDPEEINGDWKTIYMGSDNPEKISEDGELRVLLRHLECSEGCNQLTIDFYNKLNGKCQKFSVVGTKSPKGVYETDYSGENFFSIKYLSDGIIAFYNENVDEEGQVTHETLVAAKKDSLSEEELKKFEGLTEKMKIPKENIRNIIETDDCPAA